MSMTRLFISMLSVGLMVLGAGVVSGQTFPNKPIRIVTSPAGGGADFDARLTAAGIAGPLGQPVIVDNRDLATSPVLVSQAPADGYTLLVIGSNFFILPLLRPTPYDPVKDFLPITVITRSIEVLIAHASLPVTSVKELIALARAKPGELNYGSGPTASPNHLEPELFKSIAGVNFVRVPYKGTGPALNGLLSSEVQLMFAPAPVAMPHVKSGKLRALGVTSAQPSALVPGVPPIAASLPGFESVSTTTVYAPAKTPEAVINRLNQEIVRFLRTPEAKERFFNSGEETVGSSPEEVAAMIRSEMAKWGKLIKEAGIKAD